MAATCHKGDRRDQMQAGKAPQDIGTGISLLLFKMPPFVATAVARLRTSPGPAVHGRDRVGVADDNPHCAHARGARDGRDRAGEREVNLGGFHGEPQAAADRRHLPAQNVKLSPLSRVGRLSDTLAIAIAPVLSRSMHSTNFSCGRQF